MLEQLFGSGTELEPLQMGLRALCVFLIALIMIRMAGIRAFGMKSPFDYTIILLLGAILSRAVVGASPFISIVVACLVIVLMHRLFGILSIYSTAFGNLIKGDKILLYKDGLPLIKNMKKSLISNKDLAEGIRMELHSELQEDVESAYLERNGHISVIAKKK